jgi:hypothetical protein
MPNPNITIRNFCIAVQRLPSLSAPHHAADALIIINLTHPASKRRTLSLEGGTAMQKLRIVMLGFGMARQKRVLERWTNPKPLQPIWDRAAI